MHLLSKPQGSLLFAVAIVSAILAGCSSQNTPAVAKTLTTDQLMDPAACKTCHADHYRDWSNSVHAQAGDDPLFRAMHKRGQRESKGALGTFCLNCHAPIAVQVMKITGDADLDKVPAAMKGVTCYFCHSVMAVEGTHNNPLKLATDGLLRGPLADPMASPAHGMKYSPLHDRDRLDSASMCGSCHDVTVPGAAPLERTYAEWQGSVFNKAPGGQTCGQCHMNQSKTPVAIAQVAGAPLRRMHAHDFVGVDLPPVGGDTIAPKIQAFLDSSLQSAVCWAPGRLRVILDNVAAGHGFPSGANQDRRVTVEVTAYTGEQVIYQSGAVTPTADPDRWQLGDCLLDAQGKHVHMFWEEKTISGAALPGSMTFDPSDPRYYQTHVEARFPATGNLSATPDRVTVRVLLDAVDPQVLDSLVQSGDLAAADAAKIAHWQVGKTLTWTPQTANQQFVQEGQAWSCRSDTNLSASAQTVPATRLSCPPNP